MGLSKESLYVKINKDASRKDRINVQNTILSVLDDTKILFLDLNKYESD